MRSVTESTCCYCGVGCGVLIDAEDGRIVNVRGNPAHPANLGRLCTKGASLHLTALPTTRLLVPTRRNRQGGERTPLSWEAALGEAADTFARVIAEAGPDAVAFYVSGQLLTEDYYVFNKLAKGLIGTNNIDTNSRLCMSSAVAGYKRTLGADAPPTAYADIAEADLLLIAGANPAVAHPIIFSRIEDARAARPGMKIIVVDPRRSETAAIADLHLAIRPGSDVALYNAMLHVLIAEGMIAPDYIAAHTTGFAELSAIVREYTPRHAAQLCGVAAEDIVTAARWFGASPAALSMYCQGLNQSSHGADNNAALIHLHLATGQIGRPGAGPFSLTGQPNAMGGREVGGLANLLSAHRDLANPAHRAEVARLWGIPDVPAKPGRAAVEMFEAVRQGEIKALWICCTNPAQSLPDQALVREALNSGAYVVLQEAYGDTDTAGYADLLLPAASWGEKEGTVTNSERRITRVRAAVAMPGEARADWEIATRFAHRLAAAMGCPELGLQLFPYENPEAVFNEHRESTRGRDLDITGLSYALLEGEGPQQWPYPEGAANGRERLYADGVYPTADGRARFVALRHQGTAEVPDARHPFSLISGRMRDQWHGMSRTGTVPRLFNLEDEPLLSMAPQDISAAGLRAGQLVRVSNDRGSIVVRLAEQEGMRAACAWLPMHWGSRFVNHAGANALTPPVTDPISFQPELKHTAVAVADAGLDYPLVALRLCASPAEALALREAVRECLDDFPYATVSLYGSKGALVVFRAALAEPLGKDDLGQIDALFGLRESGLMAYADGARRVWKRAAVAGDRLVAVRLAGEVKAERWLRQAMAENELGASLLRFALAPRDTPPLGLVERKIICKCADVSEADIKDALAAGNDVPALQDKLKCGTFCGGCLPEIRRMAEAARQEAALAE